MNRRLEDLPANCAASKSLDRKLAAYLAAAATVGTTLATDADAAAVGNNTVVPFGINGEVPIDWNGDGNPEFEIDHDRLTDMGM